MKKPILKIDGRTLTFDSVNEKDSYLEGQLELAGEAGDRGARNRAIQMILKEDSPNLIRWYR